MDGRDDYYGYGWVMELESWENEDGKRAEKVGRQPRNPGVERSSAERAWIRPGGWIMAVASNNATGNEH